jgi:hemerythrin-like domain-containing protein
MRPYVDLGQARSRHWPVRRDLIFDKPVRPPLWESRETTNDAMTATLKILREEHSALISVLRTLLLLLADSRSRESAPDFGLLRAMIFYVSEFPEKRHHRKESDLLFPKLRARSPLSRPLLDRLDEDHMRGEFKIRELEHALTAYELIGETRRAQFEDAAKHYVDFYMTHMSLEEREIMPLALDVLTAADWEELDAAMALEPDPLTGHEPEAAYRALFDRIVFGAPAPFGLGAP